MLEEMNNFREFDVFEEKRLDELTAEEKAKIIGGRWVFSQRWSQAKGDQVRCRYVAQGYNQSVEDQDAILQVHCP